MEGWRRPTLQIVVSLFNFSIRETVHIMDTFFSNLAWLLLKILKD